MKSVRINLITRGELRYQGVVSPKFMLITLGSALTAVLLLLAAVRGIQYHYQKKDVMVAREVWSKIEPRYRTFKGVREELAHQNKVLAALKSRRERAARWADFLLMLQKTAPENIQMGHLLLSRQENSDGTGLMSLSIKGWSEGNDAEAVVIGWRKTLLADPVFGQYFDSLDLGHLRLAEIRNFDQAARRSFEFKGEGHISATSVASGGKK